ncbi:hypothetical protein CL630_03695 [bacterium]|nr:hypothetical protein [bacterium]|tara:strand:+ start:14464 stop:15159 length:696 start_codon:yes stop_codon:yes gene_type:complete
MNKNNIFIALIVLTLGGFIGYFIYTDLMVRDDFVATSVLSEEQPVNTLVEEVEDAVVEIVEVGAEDGGDAVILPNIPDLDGGIIIPDSYSLEQKEEITNKIENIIALLRQDADLFNQWLGLGLLRKSIEDYEGARQVWEYAGAIRPQNSLSFGNLGVLYGYYLQNPVLAEENYLKALENDPKLPYLYVQIADFYVEVMDSTEKAKSILEKGISEIPDDEMLKAALRATIDH